MSDWQSIPQSYKRAWLILLVGFLVSGFVGYSVKSDIDLDVQRQFASDCDETQLKIEARLQAHKQVLLGGAALFDAADSVSRNAWKAYAERVEIDQHFNGIQGLGFSLLIPKNQLARHISEIRRQGFPKYTVSPAGERGVYSSIIYLEPFKDRNLRAFGYDMYSELVRRAAMEQARDENTISLSGKVTLVQETGKDVQAGTLMYVPVYRKSMPLATVEQRRTALYGWVYSPFRMTDLLGGVLKGWDNPQNRFLRLQVYDGHGTNADSLLYHSEAGQKAISSAPVLFALERHMDFNGHEWTLHFEQLRGSVSGTDYSKAWMILAGGMSLSILSFFLMLSNLNTRRNAAQIADELTAESRKASRYARSLIEASLDPLVTISPEGKITDVNKATEDATGRNRSELIGTDFSDYFTEPDKAQEGYRQVFAKGFVTNYPLVLRHLDGHVTDVLYNASVYRDEAGKVLGVFAAARDVTERDKAETALRESEALFQAALRILPVGLWVADATGKLVFGNDKGKQIWAGTQYVSIEQYGEYKGWRLDNGKPLEAHDWGMARAIEKGEISIEEEIEIECFDGTHKIIFNSALPLRSNDGSISGAIGVNQDITERKRAETALREQAEFLRAIYESSLDALVLIDSSGIVLDWSHQAEMIFGWTKEESIGRALHETAIPLRYREAHIRGMEHFMASGEGPLLNVRTEIFALHRDGHEFPIELVIVPLKKGNHHEFNAFIRDITERKLNEAVNASRLHLVQFSLTHSLDELLEETLNEAEKLTGSAIGFYHFVEDDQIALTLQNWSTRTKAVFCKAEGKGLHYPIDEAGVWVDCVRQGKAVIHNDYASLPNRKGMPEGHATVIRELVVPVFRGKKISAILGVGNKPSNYTEKDVATVSLLADLAWEIAERKKGELELRELNNDFITLLENTDDYIYFKDQDSRIRFCSQTLARITGHSSWRDMIGKHDQEVFPKDTARIYYEEELPIFREGKPLLNKTDPYYDAQGRQRWVNTNKLPVFGDDKKTVMGIFGISRDITELKEAEDKINNLNRDLELRVVERTAQLEAANKELEAFSYSVSHDLRSPLRAIDGFSHILQDDYSGKLDDEGKRLLNVVRDNAKRMGQLIDDILKFSRTSRLEMTFSAIDMAGLARAVVEELQPAGTKLQVEIEALPPATGDPAMMHQVFVNLLSNAIKFSLARETAIIKVGGTIEGDEAIYYVKDNGAGFDMQYADKLFGVFQRLHGANEFEGTGIGLAIVKRIINRHGGRVWAEGKVNEGATVYFSIPAPTLKRS